MADFRNEAADISGGHLTQIGQLLGFAQAPTALSGLPADAPDFTGRAAQLASLPGLLAAGPVLITGPAGVGKTAFAVRGGHRLGGDVLFINLDGYAERPITASAALRAFLHALGVAPEHIPADQPAQEALYRSLLAERDPMLILLDNAASADQVRPLLPGVPGHRVLITSRHRLGDLPGARRIDLDVLAATESAAFLTATLADDRAAADPESLRRLTELCDHLPLALTIVGALLRDDHHQPLAELIGSLKGARLNELRYGPSLAVRTAFDLSYARLTAEEQFLFRVIATVLGGKVTVEAAGVLAGANVTRALAGLCRAHLLKRDPDKRERVRYHHDLLHEYAEDLLAEHERRAAAQRMIDHFADADHSNTEWLRREQSSIVDAKILRSARILDDIFRQGIESSETLDILRAKLTSAAIENDFQIMSFVSHALLTTAAAMFRTNEADTAVELTRLSIEVLAPFAHDPGATSLIAGLEQAREGFQNRG